MFIAYAALSTAGTLYSTSQQQSNADAQAKYQEQVYKANADIANRAAIQNYAALNQREIEQRAAAAQAIGQVSAQAKQAAGTARVAAGEAGVGGVSVDALLGDFERQQLAYTSSTLRNEKFAALQLASEKDAIHSQTEGRILSALPQPVQKPDFFGAALRIGTDLLGGYGDMTYFDKNLGHLAWKNNGKSANLFG